MADRHAKGRDARGQAVWSAKLDPDQVREIRRRFAAGEWPAAIAPDYGIAAVTCSQVVHRTLWAWLDPEEPAPPSRFVGERSPTAKLSDLQVEEIKQLYGGDGRVLKVGGRTGRKADGLTVTELARKYGVGTSQISRIVNGLSRISPG